MKIDAPFAQAVKSIHIPEAACVQVSNLAGLSESDYKHWANFVREELVRLRVHPEGLGSWGAQLSTAADSDDGYSAFLLAVGQAAAVPFRVELVERRYVEPVNPDLLGSYSANSRRRVSPTSRATEAGGPVIKLYVRCIERHAVQHLKCDMWVLASVVLRHELGHHIARTATEERRRYNSSSVNPQTCRPEAAAQLFAWLTGDNGSRSVMAKLHGVGSHGARSAYTVYQDLIEFARGRSSVGKALTAAHIRPGWMMAWQLTQHPRHAWLTIPKSLLTDERIEGGGANSMQEQLRALTSAIGQNSSWPILTALGQEFALLSRPCKTRFNASRLTHELAMPAATSQGWRVRHS